MIAGSHSILSKWKSLYSQALYMLGVSDVRQNHIQTAPLVPEPSAYEICMAIEYVQMHKSSCNAQIAAELIIAGDRIISKLVIRSFFSLLARQAP